MFFSLDLLKNKGTTNSYKLIDALLLVYDRSSIIGFGISISLALIGLKGDSFVAILFGDDILTSAVFWVG